MAPKTLHAVILLASALNLGSTLTSCRGRCGAEYYRGFTCQCDYSCLSYDECCQDYESQCTTGDSCKGRCGETFKRGRACTCDSDCIKFKQCCPDYMTHCDAEEISGAASETSPMKTNSCENVHDNKPKESTLAEATEEPPFSEGNNADDYLNLVDNPTSSDDPSKDAYGKGFPNDDSSNNGVKDQDASPVPECSSGYGPSADPLEEIPTTATVDLDTPEFTTESAVSHTEVTPDDNISTHCSTTEETTTVNPDARDPTRFPDQATTLPQPTAAATADPNCNQPASTSGPQAEPTSSFSATETETAVPPLDEPEVTTIQTQDSNTVLENSQVNTSPSPSASTATPEETSSDSNKECISTGSPSVMADLKDPSTTNSPAGAGNPTSTALVQDETTDNVTPEITTADPLKVTSQPNDPPTSEPTSKPQDKPDSSKSPPSSEPDTKPLVPQTLNTDNPRDYQADDSNDTNLCSGRPVSGVTTLRNGTTVVFRDHYFWILDSYQMPSPPQDITEVWGVPSPIDTVFTRCNCQGKTYIFKGGKYWRFENDVLDPGYPKLAKTGFDGLQGHVTAALSVPQYQNRKESVYFFKRGGVVQKYSYQFGTSPTCGKKAARYPIYTVQARKVRQAVPVLEPAINIRRSWRGFPTAITAAVSIPSTREPEGYKYFVFSRSTTYSVRMDGERPVIAAPPQNASPKTNTVFRCPKNA